MWRQEEAREELNQEILAKSNTEMARPAKNAPSEPRRYTAYAACPAITTPTKTSHGIKSPTADSTW